MIDESMMQLAEKAIKKGERTRVLMEVLLAEMGFTIQDEFNIFEELKKVQDEYHEACQIMHTVVMESKKLTKKNMGVS